MELEDMQAEMNMLFSELLLATDERKIVLYMLMCDLAKGIASRAGLRIQNGCNAIGDSITTAPETTEPLKVVE